MNTHSTSVNSDLTQLLDSINALTKAFRAFSTSEDRHHAIFLNAFRSLHTQRPPPSTPPLHSDHSTATAIALTPITPFKPVTQSTITIAATKERSTELVDAEQDPSPDAQPHQDLPAIPPMTPQFSEGGEKSEMLTNVEIEAEKGEELVMREQKGFEFLRAVELWVSGTPAKPPPPDPPDPTSSMTGVQISRMTVRLPPPQSPKWDPSTTVSGALASSSGHQTLLASLLSLPARGPSVSFFGLPDDGIVSFVPGGSLRHVYCSVVRRLLHQRKFQKLPSTITIPSSSLPSRASMSSEPPSSSVRSRTSPARAPFQATAPSQGPASRWPWVPWYIGPQSVPRVSRDMGILLQTKCLLSFGTDLGFITDWALLLLKRKWPEGYLMTFLFGCLIAWRLSLILGAMGFGLFEAMGAYVAHHDAILIDTDP